jgi:adenosylcobinamide-GDP ribazoletransferase
MLPLIAAFQFLTIFPTIIKRRFTSQEMGRAVGWFPLVGVVLGFVLYGVNHTAQLIFPETVSAALTLFAWIIFTRAFHLDGFMDTCDGLFGGFTPERRLEIMKDSRVGVFGVAGGVLLLLTKYSALVSSLDLLPALVLAATLGRWASPLVIFAFPYAREDGLGTEMKRNVRWSQVLLATIIALIASWFLYSWMGIVLMFATGLVAFLIALYITRLIPGLTGDSYGTITEAVETLVLMFFIIKYPNVF